MASYDMGGLVLVCAQFELKIAVVWLFSKAPTAGTGFSSVLSVLAGKPPGYVTAEQ